MPAVACGAVTVDQVVEYCLAKPGATEDYPWGDEELTVKVGGKIFAFIGLAGSTVGLKCGANTDEAGEWRQRYPEAITVSAYIGRYGWNAVRFDAVPDDQGREPIHPAYHHRRPPPPQTQT